MSDDTQDIGWVVDALREDIKSRDRRIAELVSALMAANCPYTDNLAVEICIKEGTCNCSARAALEKKT